jgi:guanylate kinase
MDICGAMSLKTLFPHVVTIFIKRDRRELITDILRKDSTVEDKANRLLSIEVEMRNTQICDYTVKFDYCDQAVEEICSRLQL